MEPQRLSAIHGWQWLKRGYALFMKAPLLWIVLLLIWLVAIILLSAVPVIGDPLTSLLLPASLVGFMVGCRALEQGDDLELALLTSGFRQRTSDTLPTKSADCGRRCDAPAPAPEGSAPPSRGRTSQLVTLGGIALVGQFLIFGVMSATGGATLVGTLMGSHVEDPEVLAQIVAGAGLAILLGAVLFSVLVMAMQFAPMLVYFNNLAPLEAMRLSLRAFSVNIGPMLIYGVTLMLLAMLASIPMMLGWLALFPVVITSLWACYCDIFPATGNNDTSSKTEVPPKLDSGSHSM
jgi:hypothetical protein